MRADLHRAYIALGANLDDPASKVRAALEALTRVPKSRLRRASSLYRTAPIGIHGQPDFINAVALLETRLGPQVLLDVLFAIEADFGRRRDFHHAPRTLDLDLLLYDDWTIKTETLILPHPRLHQRAFVLAPLLEIAPDCRIPGLGAASDWRPKTAAQRIEKLAPTRVHTPARRLSEPGSDERENRTR